ncbi:MAG TPA: hypothetical protein VFV51_00585, partial [Vicinamibacterales bacterium]|nr:hypothetical protein [Vicinamibacterales bacterium]
DERGSATTTVTVYTPAEGIATLAAMVSDRSLIAKLDAALNQWNLGNSHTPINLLKAFVHEVRAMVRSGRLANGDALITLAERIARSCASTAAQP